MNVVISCRKDKADDVDEDDMENVVFFHNNMNEVTWEMVKRWELLHKGECERDPNSGGSGEGLMI